MAKTKINPSPATSIIPVHSDMLERKITGQLLHSSLEQIREAREFLSGDYFYDSKMKELYSLMCQVTDRGETWNLISAYKEIQKVNSCISLIELTELSKEGFLSAAELFMNGGIPYLRELYQKRQLLELGNYIVTESQNVGSDMTDLSSCISDKLKLIELHDSSNNTITMQDTLKDLTSIVDRNLSDTDDSRRTLTGFKYIDDKGGLQQSDLVVIAGSTSQGKTSFANSVVNNCIKNGKKVAFYTLEMTRQQLTARLLSVPTNIYSNKLLNGKLSSDELKRFDVEVGNAWNYSANLLFDDKTSSSINNILNSIRKLKYRNNIDGVVVDYLQLISGQERGVTKEQFIAQCARKFKNLAIELDIWIIILSQLNRDKENPMPSLDRMRDSGQIAEAADIVLMVYRPQYYNEVEGRNLIYPVPFDNVSVKDTAMILLEKGRNIGTGSFVCGFDASTTHFYHIDRDNLPKNAQKIEGWNRDDGKHLL